MSPSDDRNQDPLRAAHDIYTLSQLSTGLDWRRYQDIQNDQALYDALQRWPFLLSALARQWQQDR